MLRNSNWPPSGTSPGSFTPISCNTLAGRNSPPARWLTVYDGTGAADPAFSGPTYAQSPALKGAVNREYPGTYHNDLRMDPAIVADYRVFIEAAEKASASTSSGGALGLSLLALLMAGRLWQRRRISS